MKRIRTASLIARVKIFEGNIHDISTRSINELQKKLHVILNKDYVFLAQKCNYELFAISEWSGFPDGIIEYTEDFRKHGLPHRYLILADNGDAGLILMETQDSPDKPSPIVWCDAADMYNLCKKGILEYEPIIWPSFTDFFEYLVEKEEEKLREDNS
jgi:hypothetical protein